MLCRYRGWTFQEREREYIRLKSEWLAKNPYDEKAYDAFIDRITRELGI